MKRKSQAAPAQDVPPAAVTIQFDNLPPDSRQKLDDALRGWAEWHKNKYLPGYVPPEVISGSLTYQPDTMHLAWEDKPAAPATGPTDTMWFNIKYEQSNGVPRYERATDCQLAYSAKKRPADSLLLAAEAEAASGGGGAGKAVKRLRASSRCFNCGSYGHSLRECWRALNKEMVEESKREHAEASGAAYRSGPRRYYLEGAAEGGGGGRGARQQVPGEFEGLTPGQLSEELRQALGIGALAPPPWLQRMRELGLPPGYMEAVPLPEEAAKAPAAAEGQQADGGATSQAADSAAAAAAAMPAAAQPEQPLGDFIALESSPSPKAADAPAEERPVRLECRVLFPGINARPPEGADEAAWGLAAPPPPAPPQAAPETQAQPALPPGFDSPRAAATAGVHSSQTPAPEQQWQPASYKGRGRGDGSHDREAERERKTDSERRRQEGRQLGSDDRHGSHDRERQRTDERGRGEDRERRRHEEASGGGHGSQHRERGREGERERHRDRDRSREREKERGRHRQEPDRQPHSSDRGRRSHSRERGRHSRELSGERGRHGGRSRSREWVRDGGSGRDTEGHLRWRPLHGLHPPVGGSAAHPRPQQQEHSVTPPEQPPLSTADHGSYRQLQAYGWHSSGQQAIAPASQPQIHEARDELPPGFGSPGHHSHQQHSQQPYNQLQPQFGAPLAITIGSGGSRSVHAFSAPQQQQQQLVQQGLALPVNVYSASRSDPGHLFAADQRAMAQPGGSYPQPQFSLPMQHLTAVQQYLGQQQQGLPYLEHNQEYAQRQDYAQAGQPQQLPGSTPGGSGGRSSGYGAQQLWMSDGRN